MMKNLGISTFWKCLFVNLTEVLNNQKKVVMKFVKSFLFIFCKLSELLTTKYLIYNYTTKDIDLPKVML
jgi:hypothetical protein